MRVSPVLTVDLHDATGDGRARRIRWAIASLPLALGVLPFLAYGLTLGPDNGAIRSVVALWELGLVGAWASGERAAWPFRAGRVVVVLLGWWVAAMLAATAGAAHVAPAVLRTAEWGAHGLFVLMLGAEIRRDRGVLEAVLGAVPLGFAASVVLIGLYALRLSDPFAFDWGHRIPFYQHPRYFGLSAFGAAAFAMVGLAVPEARPSARGLAWAGLTLGVAVAVWTGGRGAVGAILVAGGVMGALARGRRASFAGAFGAALVVGAALSLCAPVANPNFGLGRLLGTSAAIGSADAFTSGRTAIWATTLAAWRAHPWLGAGPDAGVFLLARYEVVQPHNVVLQALLEWGVLGAVPALLLLAALLVRAVAAAWKEPPGMLRAARSVAAAYLVGAAAGALMDGLFYDARALLLTGLAAAVALLPGDGAGERPAPMSPRARRRTAGAAAFGIVLFTLHLLAARALWSPAIPAPDSARVHLLRAVPTPSNLFEVMPWIRAWTSEDPEAALALARWGSRHATAPVPFLHLEGDLLLQRGDSAQAAAAFRRAGRLRADEGRP